MISNKIFKKVAIKYGFVASWAVWVKVGKKPTSNMGDLSIFDLKTNPNILKELNTNIVMVGLNISNKINCTFGNFHANKRYKHDYKLRYTFSNTKYSGAYMTDIIKDFEHKISNSVKEYLKLNPSFEKENVKLFKKELEDIETNNPLIIAFGKITFDILKQNLGNNYNIVKIPHYSNYISKESYKKQVLRILNASK